MRQRPPDAPPAAVACTLGSNELRAQAGRWKKLFAGAAVERTRTPTGLRVSFRRDPLVERELRELVAVEAECCAWASWTVEATAHELTLEVASAGDGVSVIHGWSQLA